MINDEQDINDTEVFTKLSIEILKKTYGITPIFFEHMR